MISALFAAVAVAQAVTAAPPPPPPPPAVVPPAIRDWLTGAWRGAGTFERTGKPVESTLDVTAETAGESLLLRERDAPPNRTIYSAIMSADSRTGDLVLMYVSNFGAGARLFRSKGLADGKIVFTTDPSLRAWFAAERFTFERAAGGGLTLCYDSSKDGGAIWRRGDCQTYTKRSG